MCLAFKGCLLSCCSSSIQHAAFALRTKGNIDAETKDARARKRIGQHLMPNIRTNTRHKNIPNLTRFSSYFFLGTRYHKVPTFRLPTPVLMRPSSKEWRRCSSWTFLTPRYIRPSATWMSYILGFWNGRPRQPLAHPGMRIITGPAPVEVTRSEENGRNKIIILPPDVSPLWRPRVGNRKVWKSGGGANSNVVGIICHPWLR